MNSSELPEGDWDIVTVLIKVMCALFVVACAVIFVPMLTGCGKKEVPPEPRAPSTYSVEKKYEYYENCMKDMKESVGDHEAEWPTIMHNCEAFAIERASQ